jgi:cob(I)alamin adenosyltransferase
MNISLINGSFENKEAIDILTQLVNVKIKYHENKIHHAHNEEDIKMRERRIKELQKDLFELRNFIQHQKNNISLHCHVELSK